MKCLEYMHLRISETEYLALVSLEIYAPPNLLAYKFCCTLNTVLTVTTGITKSP